MFITIRELLQRDKIIGAGVLIVFRKKRIIKEWLIMIEERREIVSDDLSVSLVLLYNLLFSVKQFFCAVYTYINNYD